MSDSLTKIAIPVKYDKYYRNSVENKCFKMKWIYIKGFVKEQNISILDKETFTDHCDNTVVREQKRLNYMHFG